MSRPAFFSVLIALILGIIYIMYGSDNPPETSMNQTPKEYIELVEQKKAARMAVEKALKQGEEHRRQVLQEAESQR
jgi:predicted nucleotide-binding protein (sugar kinase/HSP70/actin superfamily)